MNLTPGTKLGPYEIVAPLGAGGMGEVYRARDTRLGRDVAVKVLPSHLSSNPEVRARFEREARAVSSLNHPNICTLHDIGREGDTDYLVMELIQGETLAARVARGPLPTEQVLTLGSQIADALSRAHRAGIVHRDLKPGNVMLTRSGAKLMDFGLARATALDADASGELSHSPTVAQPLTAEGTIVGTFQYMAPEQLEGKEADARTDLWALGCVLYETATGACAFEGKSQASLISSIMKDQPRPIAERQPLAPAALDRLVRACLEKDPDDRWQSAGDLERELLWIADAGSGTGAPVGAPARQRRSLLGWWVAAAFAVAAFAIASVAFHATRRVQSQPTFAAVTYHPMAIYRAAFGPDGKTIVFSGAREGNTPHLFVIRPESPEPQPFGPPGTQLLSVSSQGELAVLTGASYIGHRLCTGTLARMPLGGEAPREILEKVREADWNPDGTQLAIIREVEGKDRLEFPIGHVLYESGGYVSDLRFSPEGDRIAFFEHPFRWDDRGSLNVVDLRGRKTLLSDGYESEEGIAWQRDGRQILFSATATNTGLMVYAITLDGKRRLLESGPGHLTIQDASREGKWLVSVDDRPMRVMVRTPAWPADRDLSWLNSSVLPILSRDKRTVVFCELRTLWGNNYSVCLRSTDGGDVVRLGEGIAWDLSADGKRVLAMVSSPPHVVIYPTGAGEPVVLDRGGIENYGDYGRWFAGGDSVLFVANEPGKASRFWVQRVAGGPPRAVTPEGAGDGVLSDDGTFVLAKGPDEHCRVYPFAGGKSRIVTGLQPEDGLIRTSADGRSALVYRFTIPSRVDRVELESGRRSPVKEIAPADRAGLLGIVVTYVSDDGGSYAYYTVWDHSTLYTVDWGS